MTDYKEIIISELDILRKKEIQQGNTFKGIAYSKVIQQIKQKDTIRSMDDIKDIKGIGESIQHKLEEIFQTGKLQVAEEVRKDTSIDDIDRFMNIYGIGRVKAVKLVKENNLHTIEELREAVKKDPSLLNKNQIIGLNYYEDLIERIPRMEMKKHEKLLKKIISNLDIEIVGSYRRGEPTSGDIDVLVKWPANMTLDEIAKTLDDIVKNLIDKKYLTEVLAHGDKKCMGICQLPGGKARRLDLLITPENEYGYAILYFTGSDKFNIALRKVALEKGYSLNEHGFTSMDKTKYPEAPKLFTEKEIMNFLGFDYIEPKKRKVGIKLDKFITKIS